MKKGRIKWIIVIVSTALFLCCLPDPLFDKPYSKVMYDGEGKLLGAQVATDGQWRFPENLVVPDKFATAIVAFEDKRFYYHPGFDPASISRAVVQNVKEKKVVSGASTLTMQMMRMAGNNSKRTIIQKLKETILAVRSEVSYSKKEILGYYSSHAPFGGNVVGLDAASWRYFGKSSHYLSWAETATLAVLPNAPALIHPGRNRTKLIDKRNRLLKTLLENEDIDQHIYELSLEEPLPEKPLPLPRYSPHLMNQIDNSFSLGGLNTTIDLAIQEKLISIANSHHQANSQKGIENLGILVIDNYSGKVIGYVGNTNGSGHENAVDMIRAERSSGSILKPFLYASMMQEGLISPNQLLQDIPLSIDGFSPKNYNKKYSGATKASLALARSLNVPAVEMLQKYRIEKFINKLQALGMSSVDKSKEYYGLSLILGGSEVRLWDLCNAYSLMAQKLNHYYTEKKEIVPYVTGDSVNIDFEVFDEGVIYATFDAMKKVVRPDQNGNWEDFVSAQPLAWKTGTSYGHRDAWAVGVNPNYTIGVWVGNADGEGRTEIIGSKLAGSVLFDVLYSLPNGKSWFDMPHDEQIEMKICKGSGHLASQFCDVTENKIIPSSCEWAPSCPYHIKINLDPSKKYRADLSCYSNVVDTSWFVLPPSMAYYYKKQHAEYEELPPYDSNCDRGERTDVIALLYPSSHHKVYIPNGLNGDKMTPIFKASHNDPSAILYWHIDNNFISATKDIHEIKIDSKPGIHKLTLIDSAGNTLDRTFEVLGK